MFKYKRYSPGAKLNLAVSSVTSICCPVKKSYQVPACGKLGLISNGTTSKLPNTTAFKPSADLSSLSYKLIRFRFELTAKTAKSVLNVFG